MTDEAADRITPPAPSISGDPPESRPEPEAPARLQPPDADAELLDTAIKGRLGDDYERRGSG